MGAGWKVEEWRFNTTYSLLCLGSQDGQVEVTTVEKTPPQEYDSYDIHIIDNPNHTNLKP